MWCWSFDLSFRSIDSKVYTVWMLFFRALSEIWDLVWKKPYTGFREVVHMRLNIPIMTEEFCVKLETFFLKIHNASREREGEREKNAWIR